MLDALHKSIHPVVMSIADDEKIIGHNLNGRKFILKPVNKEATARTIRHNAEIIQTAVEMTFFGSIIVTAPTMMPIKISATPSVIHSIVIIFLL
jgi:hypothetical protein